MMVSLATASGNRGASRPTRGKRRPSRFPAAQRPARAGAGLSAQYSMQVSFGQDQEVVQSERDVPREKPGL